MNIKIGSLYLGAARGGVSIAATPTRYFRGFALGLGWITCVPDGFDELGVQKFRDRYSPTASFTVYGNENGSPVFWHRSWSLRRYDNGTHFVKMGVRP